MQIVRVADRYDPHATSRRQRVPWRRRRAAVSSHVHARRRDELSQPRSESLPPAEAVRMPAERIVGSSAQRVSFDTSKDRLLGALRQQCQEARQEWQRRQCDGCSCGRGAYGCSPAAGSPACASKAQHGVSELLGAVTDEVFLDCKPCVQLVHRRMSYVSGLQRPSLRVASVSPPLGHDSRALDYSEAATL